jgi:hypothetical protein
MNDALHSWWYGGSGVMRMFVQYFIAYSSQEGKGYQESLRKEKREIGGGHGGSIVATQKKVKRQKGRKQ